MEFFVLKCCLTPSAFITFDAALKNHVSEKFCDLKPNWKLLLHTILYNNRYITTICDSCNSFHFITLIAVIASSIAASKLIFHEYENQLTWKRRRRDERREIVVINDRFMSAFNFFTRERKWQKIQSMISKNLRN